MNNTNQNSLNVARKSVIIAEDDIDIREAFRELLEDHGFKVSEARNGLEALALMKQKPLPDIVLTDLMMPIMDGKMLVERIRMDKKLKFLPVIIMTASTAKIDGVPCFRKPCDFNLLVSTIEKLCVA